MKNTKFTRDEALAFHMEPVPGKWEVNATVPMACLLYTSDAADDP